MLFDGNEFAFGLPFIEDEMSFSNYKFNFENKKENKFFDSKEGFLKGNMTKKEYVPYKNYKIESLRITNAQEELLFKVMEYYFALNDLNLYLDLHPEDNETLDLFKMYVEKYKKVKKEYAEKYGPLILTQAKYQDYKWIKNPWPWDRFGGSMYV